MMCRCSTNLSALALRACTSQYFSNLQDIITQIIKMYKIKLHFKINWYSEYVKL